MEGEKNKMKLPFGGLSTTLEDGSTKIFALPDPTVSVGTALSCRFRIQGPEIDHVQATINFDGKTVHLTHGSKISQTLVNGINVPDSCILKHDDIISFGHSDAQAQYKMPDGSKMCANFLKRRTLHQELALSPIVPRAGKRRHSVVPKAGSKVTDDKNIPKTGSNSSEPETNLNTSDSSEVPGSLDIQSSVPVTPSGDLFSQHSFTSVGTPVSKKRFSTPYHKKFATPAKQPGLTLIEEDSDLSPVLLPKTNTCKSSADIIEESEMSVTENNESGVMPSGDWEFGTPQFVKTTPAIASSKTPAANTTVLSGSVLQELFFTPKGASVDDTVESDNVVTPAVSENLAGAMTTQANNTILSGSMLGDMFVTPAKTSSLVPSGDAVIQPNIISARPQVSEDASEEIVETTVLYSETPARPFTESFVTTFGKTPLPEVNQDFITPHGICPGSPVMEEVVSTEYNFIPESSEEEEVENGETAINSTTAKRSLHEVLDAENNENNLAVSTKPSCTVTSEIKSDNVTMKQKSMLPRMVGKQVTVPKKTSKKTTENIEPEVTVSNESVLESKVEITSAPLVRDEIKPFDAKSMKGQTEFLTDDEEPKTRPLSPTKKFGNKNVMSEVRSSPRLAAKKFTTSSIPVMKKRDLPSVIKNPKLKRALTTDLGLMKKEKENSFLPSGPRQETIANVAAEVNQDIDPFISLSNENSPITSAPASPLKPNDVELIERLSNIKCIESFKHQKSELPKEKSNYSKFLFDKNDGAKAVVEPIPQLPEQARDVADLMFILPPAINYESDVDSDGDTCSESIPTTVTEDEENVKSDNEDQKDLIETREDSVSLNSILDNESAVQEKCSLNQDATLKSSVSDNDMLTDDSMSSSSSGNFDSTSVASTTDSDFAVVSQEDLVSDDTTNNLKQETTPFESQESISENLEQEKSDILTAENGGVELQIVQESVTSGDQRNLTVVNPEQLDLECHEKLDDSFTTESDNFESNDSMEVNVGDTFLLNINKTFTSAESESDLSILGTSQSEASSFNNQTNEIVNNSKEEDVIDISDSETNEQNSSVEVSNTSCKVDESENIITQQNVEVQDTDTLTQEEKAPEISEAVNTDIEIILDEQNVEVQNTEMKTPPQEEKVPETSPADEVMNTDSVDASENIVTQQNVEVQDTNTLTQEEKAPEISEVVNTDIEIILDEQNVEVQEAEIMTVPQEEKTVETSPADEVMNYDSVDASQNILPKQDIDVQHTENSPQEEIAPEISPADKVMNTDSVDASESIVTEQDIDVQHTEISPDHEKAPETPSVARKQLKTKTPRQNKKNAVEASPLVLRTPRAKRGVVSEQLEQAPAKVEEVSPETVVVKEVMNTVSVDASENIFTEQNVEDTETLPQEEKAPEISKVVNTDIKLILDEQNVEVQEAEIMTLPQEEKRPEISPADEVMSTDSVDASENIVTEQDIDMQHTETSPDEEKAPETPSVVRKQFKTKTPRQNRKNAVEASPVVPRTPRARRGVVKVQPEQIPAKIEEVSPDTVVVEEVMNTEDVDASENILTDQNVAVQDTETLPQEEKAPEISEVVNTDIEIILDEQNVEVQEAEIMTLPQEEKTPETSPADEVMNTDSVDASENIVTEQDIDVQHTETSPDDEKAPETPSVGRNQLKTKTPRQNRKNAVEASPVVPRTPRARRGVVTVQPEQIPAKIEEVSPETVPVEEVMNTEDVDASENILTDQNVVVQDTETLPQEEKAPEISEVVNTDIEIILDEQNVEVQDTEMMTPPQEEKVHETSPADEVMNTDSVDASENIVTEQDIDVQRTETSLQEEIAPETPSVARKQLKTKTPRQNKKNAVEASPLVLRTPRAKRGVVSEQLEQAPAKVEEVSPETVVVKEVMNTVSVDASENVPTEQNVAVQDTKTLPQEEKAPEISEVVDTDIKLILDEQNVEVQEAEIMTLSQEEKAPETLPADEVMNTDSVDASENILPEQDIDVQHTETSPQEEMAPESPSVARKQLKTKTLRQNKKNAVEASPVVPRAPRARRGVVTAQPEQIPAKIEEVSPDNVVVEEVMNTVVVDASENILTEQNVEVQNTEIMIPPQEEKPETLPADEIMNTNNMDASENIVTEQHIDMQHTETSPQEQMARESPSVARKQLKTKTLRQNKKNAVEASPVVPRTPRARRGVVTVQPEQIPAKIEDVSPDTVVVEEVMNTVVVDASENILTEQNVAVQDTETLPQEENAPETPSAARKQMKAKTSRKSSPVLVFKGRAKRGAKTDLPIQSVAKVDDALSGVPVEEIIESDALKSGNNESQEILTVSSSTQTEERIDFAHGVSVKQIKAIEAPRSRRRAGIQVLSNIESASVQESNATDGSNSIIEGNIELQEAQSSCSSKAETSDAPKRQARSRKQDKTIDEAKLPKVVRNLRAKRGAQQTQATKSEEDKEETPKLNRGRAAIMVSTDESAPEITPLKRKRKQTSQDSDSPLPTRKRANTQDSEVSAGVNPTKETLVKPKRGRKQQVLAVETESSSTSQESKTLRGRQQEECPLPPSPKEQKKRGRKQQQQLEVIDLVSPAPAVDRKRKANTETETTTVESPAPSTSIAGRKRGRKQQVEEIIDIASPVVEKRGRKRQATVEDVDSPSLPSINKKTKVHQVVYDVPDSPVHLKRSTRATRQTAASVSKEMETEADKSKKSTNSNVDVVDLDTEVPQKRGQKKSAKVPAAAKSASQKEESEKESKMKEVPAVAKRTTRQASKRAI